MQNDLTILRELTKAYAELAQQPANAERVERYRELNRPKPVRPPALVFEVPWGELHDDALRLQCVDPEARALEDLLRKTLYQWQCFQGDFAVHPYARVPVALRQSGYGVESDEHQRSAATGSDIQSHEYLDCLPDEEAVARLHFPTIELDETLTDRRFSLYSEAFDGLLPVKKAGVSLYFASWDQIPRLHGVENCLMDLYDRPEFAHLLIERFTQFHEYELTRYEELNVLDTDPYYLHCTPACTYELPVKDMGREKITAKDVWCRAMAQLFAVVSPEMHNEFDWQYTKRLFDRCGLAYYGCCEPLDGKIEWLRQFPNLRRISITPWADVDVAADKIGGDYVLSYKSNPAFVASPTFDPEPVIAETKRVLAACKRNHTPCEFILKDISTVSNNPSHLTAWVQTVNETIESYA